MDLPPWLILRQASEAVANGRPDDAHRLIAPLVDEGHRRAWRAAREVVRGYCSRARRSLDQDNADTAWRDLLAAEALNTGEACVAELRQSLTRLGLAEARAALEAGNPVTAAEQSARLRERGVRHPDLPGVEEAARDWLAAAAKADRGDFLPAIDDLHRLRSKLPCPPTGLDRFREAVAARHERFLDAVGRVQEAAGLRRWRDAVAAADEALAAAPDYHVARTLRTKAWQAAFPEVGESTLPFAGQTPAGLVHSTADLSADTQSYHGQPAGPPVGAPPAPLTTQASRAAGRPDRSNPRGNPADPRGDRPTREGGILRGAVPTAGSDRGSVGGGAFGSDRSPLPKRFLLWVDGVAGLLVCTAPRVTFGQAVLEGGPVDIPLFADVSRIHAELSRDGEGYLVESGRAAPANGKEFVRTVLVNGKEVSRSVLAPGDRVTLGTTCQFVFHRPVPVSSTARLELTSGHRLMLPVEGVLLMANEVILGPDSQAHVVVRSLPDRVLLYRSKEGLGVRVAGGKFQVNDVTFADRASVPFPAVVTADGITFAVEPVGPRF